MVDPQERLPEQQPIDFMAKVDADSAQRFLGMVGNPDGLALKRIAETLATADTPEVASFLSHLRASSTGPGQEVLVGLYRLGVSLANSLIQLSVKDPTDIPLVEDFDDQNLLQKQQAIAELVRSSRNHKSSTIRRRLRKTGREDASRMLDQILKVCDSQLSDWLYVEGSQDEIVRGYVDMFDAANLLTGPIKERRNHKHATNFFFSTIGGLILGALH